MWNGAWSGVGQQCRTSTLVVRMVMGVRMVAVGGDNFFIRRRRFPELALLASDKTLKLRTIIEERVEVR